MMARCRSARRRVVTCEPQRFTTDLCIPRLPPTLKEARSRAGGAEQPLAGNQHADTRGSSAPTRNERPRGRRALDARVSGLLAVTYVFVPADASAAAAA